MKDEFFDDIPAPSAEVAPSPAGNYKPSKLRWKKRLKIIGCVVGALVLAGLVFGAGFLSGVSSIDPYLYKMAIIKEMIDELYYKEISDDEFYGILYGAINEQILDKYSEYMSADEYQALLQDYAGNRSGIGVSLETTTGENAYMRIIRVCGNSPAEEVGLQEGAYIVGFGKTEESLKESGSYQEFAEFLETMKTEEPFYLRLEENGEYGVVQICKREYVENYVFYRTHEKGYTFSQDGKLQTEENANALQTLPSDTAYIRLVQFTGDAAKEFDAAMKLFKSEGKKNLVLDLRGNGGGYVDVMQDICKYFCKNSDKKKPVVAVTDNGKEREKYYATGNVYHEYFAEGSRIMVLADRQTASASECLLGCMLDYGAIGYEDICLTERDGVAKTYGKGIMQTTYYVDIFEKDALKLTTAKIRWPLSDTCIHERGILSSDGTKTVNESYAQDEVISNALLALLG